MKTLSQLTEWQALLTHKNTIAHQHMQDWFKENPERFTEFSLSLDGILFDYSKNRITAETLQRLINLADSQNLSEKIAALFNGKIVNHSEKRAALHTALRTPAGKSVLYKGKNIIPEIHAVLNNIREFTDKIRNQHWLGHTGKPIRSIVNIGIGGSHLGPLMTTHALTHFAAKHLQCYFISNVDSTYLHEVLNKIDPETTLFIVSSKSFSTIETMTNAKTIRDWLQQKLGAQDIKNHFIAITGNIKAALAFGIPQENIFPLWDWVGGRYSIWSAIGLPLALMIGMDLFLEFLAGAHAVDEHFRETEFSKNIPVLMGLLGIWYINFFGASHHAVVSYSHHLNYLRDYLQQLDMESNGKNLSQQGAALDITTAPVTLGEQGCNSQHAFHQLLHQGSHVIPVDFILTGANDETLIHHHDILIGSGLSQAQALMRGKSFAEALHELQQAGYSTENAEFLAQHKVTPGNRPSNILFLDKITPYHLGALLALYEHKTFVQGAIWDINSFDQWGVELGKTLLPQILEHLHNGAESNTMPLDSSTQHLIQHYKNLRNP